MSIRTLTNPDDVAAGIARALDALDGVNVDPDVRRVIARRAVELALNRQEAPSYGGIQGREPLELLPQDGRCLYDDERSILERIASEAADGHLLFDRDELDVVRAGLDRLGVLRFRRLDELGRRER